MGGQRAVPKKKASGWDRPGLPSGGKGPGGCRRRGRCPRTRSQRAKRQVRPAGAPRPRPSWAPLPAARTPRAHLTSPASAAVRPGGAPGPSSLLRLLRGQASPVAALSQQGMEGARLRERSLKGCHSAIA
uniref:Uncharacterized protein n=1 Tax=Rousettus aegyptiacus TaxID=9407 RepID=A0A7J8C2B4_ROUAE|nr:hypothetical protein HJG63_009323 [Rousettus aegyptiacus]